MQSTLCDDEEPGSHSWRAMFSTTLDGPLPEHVTDVRGWLEERTPERQQVDDGWTDSTMDTPTERLRDLGYID
jgi:hypothetical protein